MKLTYLGTAAAEGWPAVYCNCDHCLRAKKAGGRNLRTRSQAIINDDLLIDYPGDTFCHMLQNRLDLSAVQNIIVTHAHVDHFQPSDMVFRNESCYCHDRTVQKLDIYGSDAVCARYDELIIRGKEDVPDRDTFMHELPLYTPAKIGNYTVTALRANHAHPQNAYCYIVSDGKSTLLYLHDTGRLYDEVYDYLNANKVKADLVSLDCTYVALPSAGGHMGLDSNQVERDRLAENGIIDEHTKLVINHFSHNGKLIHDELVPVAAEMGFVTAYDGMAIEF